MIFLRYNEPRFTGRGAVRLARLHGVLEVRGSIPLAPTGEKTPIWAAELH